MPKILTPEKALERLQTMCARAEHSTGEIVEKLRRWMIAPADASKIIDTLVADRYIDDRRFARAYANDKIMFARWGRRKVAQQLALKRVERPLIDEVLENVDMQAYTDNLDHLIEHRMKSSDITTYEGRTRLFRFLVSRGYEPDLAASRLRNALANK